MLYDLIEDNPEIKAIIDASDIEAESKLANSEHRNKMGFCHLFWMVKTDILKNKYGIEWKSPSVMNPDVMFD